MSDQSPESGDTRAPAIARHEHCEEGACESCDCCSAGWCVAFQDGDPFMVQFYGFSKPYSDRLVIDAHAEFEQWCDAVMEAWGVTPRPDAELVCGQRNADTGEWCLLEEGDHHTGHIWRAREMTSPPGQESL